MTLKATRVISKASFTYITTFRYHVTSEAVPRIHPVHFYLPEEEGKGIEEFGLDTHHLILLVHTVVSANDDSYNIILEKVIAREHL